LRIALKAASCCPQKLFMSIKDYKKK